MSEYQVFGTFLVKTRKVFTTLERERLSGRDQNRLRSLFRIGFIFLKVRRFGGQLEQGWL
jgi:hypothetical protein